MDIPPPRIPRFGDPEGHVVGLVSSGWPRPLLESSRARASATGTGLWVAVKIEARAPER